MIDYSNLQKITIIKPLIITKLTKIYANNFKAVNDINLTVNEGDFLALLGKNGAGKSTTIGIICSLVKKTSGEVLVCGHNIETNPNEAKLNVGVVSQEFNFPIFDKLVDILINQAGFYGVSKSLAYERAKKYLKLLELWDKKDNTPMQISGGMKRRLMIAKALMHEPKMLILDEPTAGVDIEIRHLVWEFLKSLNKSGVTIILTTHYLEEAQYLCNKLAIIDHGKIVYHKPMKEIFVHNQTSGFIIKVDNSSLIEPSHDIQIISNEEIIISTNEKNLGIILNKILLAGAVIHSVTPRFNPLEELFLNLTDKKNAN